VLAAGLRWLLGHLEELTREWIEFSGLDKATDGAGRKLEAVTRALGRQGTMADAVAGK
jgi:hypothetical protein